MTKMTSRLQEILTESKKTYPFKIGIVGAPKDIDVAQLETALQKFVVEKMSAGKKTPIMKRPLDFPALENQDVELGYPTTAHVLQQYIKNCCGIQESHLIVRNPNEPQEEYQEEKSDAPYEAKLNSAYEDSKDEQKSGGNNRVMDLLKELEKDRKERSAPDAIGEIKAPKDGGATSKVDDGNKTSPISGKAKGK